MKFLLKLCMASAMALAAGAAHAEYPERPITLVVPFEPGGSTDILGRIVAEHLTQTLGSPVTVENRGGGGGTIGAAVVANAQPDGYTLLFATSGTHSINPNLRKVDYDPIGGFVPISLAVETPVLVIANPDIGVKTLQDLIDVSKAEPGKFNFASAGNGSTSHLAGELFNQLTGAEMVHIPYPGAGPAMNDVLAGRVQIFMNNMPPFVPHVKSGTVVPLAMASEKRSAILPDVPTAAEAGLDGFVVAGWFGVVAPAGTPEEMVEKLHQAMLKMDSSDAIKEKLFNVGSEVSVSPSREDFAGYIKRELERWGGVVAKSKARVD